MKVKDFNGKEHSISVAAKLNTNASSYHKLARKLLVSMFPFEVISEEISIPTTRLKCDFFLTSTKLVVEVHGEQHYTFNPFFYSNKMEFMRAKSRDNKKVEWCEINGFDYVELSYKESTDEWRSKIINAITT